MTRQTMWRTRQAALGLQAMLAGLTRLGITSSFVGIGLGLVGAWISAYLAGGSHTPFPHLFYFPIALAAARFAWSGALVTGSVAGFLAGPALPADVETGLSQTVAGWAVRLLAFLSVAMFIAWLGRGNRDSIRRDFRDALVASRLRRAIDEGQLYVAYQPIVELGSLRPVAVEALIRWADTRLGEVPPAHFIPAAERTGAVRDLDRFVIAAATEHAALWAADDVPPRVCVNVSATWFGQDDLVTAVRQALEQSGLPPAQLEIEVTESALVGDFEQARRQLQELRGLGVRIAIDDFGAGHTTIGYLIEFEVDTIKMDRGLVARLRSDPGALRVVTGLVGMLNSMGLDVVAEGIETEQDYRYAHAAGFPIGQGFHLGRPASLPDRWPAGAMPL